MLADMLESKEEKALILIFYGVGHNKCCDKLYQILYKAQIDNKTQIALASQCPKGNVEVIDSNKIQNVDDLEYISNSNNEKQTFDKLDILNAGDMTIEACVTKIAYLMGKGLRGIELKKQFETNLRGERTQISENVKP